MLGIIEKGIENKTAGWLQELTGFQIVYTPELFLLGITKGKYDKKTNILSFYI